MDKRTWIGFGLIAVIIVGFALLNRPSKEQLAERQRVQDSIRYAQELAYEAQRLSDSIQAVVNESITTAPESGMVAPTVTDEEINARLQAAYGPFAPAAQGEEQLITLSNEHLQVAISTHGGAPESARLLDYHASGDTINPLCLFQGDESDLAFTLVTANNRVVQTSSLYLTPVPADSANQAILRLPTDQPDAWMDFIYTLSEDYMLHLSIEPHNMQTVLAQNINTMEMQWRQIIPQQEQGRKFEERYAQLQYMLPGGDTEKLSENKDDDERESARVKWIAYKDQFFSTVLIADEAFTSSEFRSVVQPKHSGYIKEYMTHTSLPYNVVENSVIGMRWYMGPNHYHTLKAYDEDVDKENRLHLNKLVPLGWKIVSWINVILVIPMFDLFMGWGLHIGWVLILMTLVIKLIILPFVFVSYKSSAKMRALKPQIDAINEKYPAEKMQERQQAIMKLYQQAGVSPMSGCRPMLFQFPVLLAMFWFLPTAIELRGKSLLWAPDLSTYDAVFHWSFDIPFLGDHLSLFCLLMTIVNVIYTYLTMQSQATDPNMKFMKYMMYAMPVMFLFIFNDYAAGLSFYYLVSLFITIMQTMIFRWTLNDKKMLEEIERNKKKKAGKPQSGFMARLEALQRQQQQMARENAKKNMRR